MKTINALERGLDVLRTLDRPLLGVCVGVQLLFAHSEEDDTPCLGLLPGRVRKLHAAPGMDEQALLRMLSAELDRRERDKAARIQASYTDWN